MERRRFAGAGAGQKWVEAMERRVLLSGEAAAPLAAENLPPAIDVTVSSLVAEDTPVAFTARLADPEQALSVLTVSWGDGQSTIVNDPAESSSLSHFWTDPGTYTITALVRDAAGAEASVTLKMQVTERPPQPTIIGAAQARPGRPYVLQLRPDPAADDPVLYWTIDWGDGTFQDAKGDVASISHRYKRSGRYRIAVSATDRTGSHRASPEGQVRWAGLVVAVNNRTPKPTFSAPSAAVPGQSIRFSGKTNDGSAAGYSVAWDFGDGRKARTAFAQVTHSSTTPAHTYARPGLYTVRMWVKNAAGKVGSATKNIRVAPVVIQTRPDRRGETSLVVGGTAGNDVIRFLHRWGGVEAMLNGRSLGVFHGDRVVAYGGKGDDSITVDDLVGLPAELDGGDGNDRLHASSESRILIGGPGLDRISGGGSEWWE